MEGQASSSRYDVHYAYALCCAEYSTTKQLLPPRPYVIPLVISLLAIIVSVFNWCKSCMRRLQAGVNSSGRGVVTRIYVFRTIVNIFNNIKSNCAIPLRVVQPIASLRIFIFNAMGFFVVWKHLHTLLQTCRSFIPFIFERQVFFITTNNDINNKRI